MNTSPVNHGGDDRLREPPVERFAADQHAFDLKAEIEALKAEHPPTGPSSRGHRQKTLYKRGGATIALFRFERGGGLATHKTNGTVTIHVIDGKMRIRTGRELSSEEKKTGSEKKGVRSDAIGAGSSLIAHHSSSAGPREHFLAADQLVILAPNVPHDVHALEASTMLLQVHLDAPTSESM